MEGSFDFASYKEALIVLGAAGVVIPLVHRLRFSPVLGFMLVGMAVGPFGLGALAAPTPWLSAVTIDDPAAIAPIAELGVVLLMFMIGLELSFERLWLMRRLVFGLGTLQVAACAAALTGAALALGRPSAERRGDRHRAGDVLHRRRAAGAVRREAARHARPGAPASPSCCSRTWRWCRCCSCSPRWPRTAAPAAWPASAIADRPGAARRRRDRRAGPAGAAPAVPQRRTHPQRGTVRRRLPAGGDRQRRWPPRRPACRWRSAR